VKDQLAAVGIDVAKLLAPVAVALAGLAAARLEKWIRGKVRNEYAAGALARLSEAVVTAVAETAQVYVDVAKARASDGKLTEAERQEAKARAVSSAKLYLGSKGVSELSKVLGLQGQALDALIGAKVESTVRALGSGLKVPMPPAG